MAEIPSSCPRCGAKNTSGAWMCWRCNSGLLAPPVPAPAANAPAQAPLPPAQPPSPSPQLSAQSLQAPVPTPAPTSAQAILVAADYDLSLLSSSPRRQARTRQPVLWVMVVASLALLIVTPMVMKGVLPKSSELPSSIEGYTRVDNDPTVNRAKDELAKAALREGASVTAAVYRHAGKWLVVEVYTGISAELTASDLLGTLADNLQSQARTTVVMAQVTRTYGENGVTQAC